MSLRQYTSPEELQGLLDSETAGDKREQPENNLLENTLKIAIAGEFTTTKLELYGYPDACPQYYFFVEHSDVQCPFIIVRNRLSGPDVCLLKEAVPLLVAKLSDLLAKHNTLLVSADVSTCDEFERHISSLPNSPFTTVPLLSSTGVFYMTQAQREELLKENLEAPEGFTFERADAERDSETIHRLWKTALDLEVTKNRLRYLPSACARTVTGELAGWAMTSRIGQVTNLYVLPEYRHRGLGKALELSVARQFASRGMRVFKYVETTNTPVYEGSLRSPLWTLWTTIDDDEQKPILHSLRKFERRSV